MWSDSVLREIRGRNRTSLEVETMAVTPVWKDLPRQGQRPAIKRPHWRRRHRAAAPHPEDPRTHDVVALEHRAGFVTRQLHRDAFRDARPHQTAHRRATKIVRDPTRTPRGDARLPPRFVEPAFGDRLAGLLVHGVAKDVARNEALLALQLFRDDLLIFQHPPQRRRERKCSTLPVFRRARVESHLADFQVDLPPLQREDLARRPPARDEGKRDDAAHLRRQVVRHTGELFRFEEALPNVVLFQHRNVGTGQQLAGLHRLVVDPP